VTYFHISILTQLTEELGGVRAIAEGRGGRLMVGTTRNCLAAGSFEGGLTGVALGHTEEVWGLATHPALPQFATGGHDRMLRMWDSQSRSAVWSLEMTEQLQSASFAPDGTVLAVGMTSGRWQVLDVETREVLAQGTDGNEPIQVCTSTYHHYVFFHTTSSIPQRCQIDMVLYCVGYVPG
jgi:microtubule-associated protein-like 1/2